MKELGIELFIALIITLSSAYVVKGDYNFYIGGPSGIGHGFPYYHSFTDLEQFQISFPEAEKDLTGPSNQKKDLNVTDFSVIMTSAVNFLFNIIFWFFIASVFYTILGMKILFKGRK